jgi:hypothetical protein
MSSDAIKRRSNRHAETAVRLKFLIGPRLQPADCMAALGAPQIRLSHGVSVSAGEATTMSFWRGLLQTRAGEVNTDELASHLFRGIPVRACPPWMNCSPPSPHCPEVHLSEFVPRRF